ncbi:13648_t:CDS:2, partial [Rhizophagus irregularis]
MGNAQRLETAGIALSLNKNALDVKDILNKKALDKDWRVETQKDHFSHLPILSPVNTEQ